MGTDGGSQRYGGGREELEAKSWLDGMRNGGRRVEEK